ncbi:uncharacterized protein BJ171DRAFT_494776, partial [Polychytrium aggregatum]|uniref:uncharacterized protein n=1 Tax=Polychytrium aggregatum TaxID=110093 RepID=UPI0022FEBF51
MGETGVGKSTLINAVANYVSFKSLEEACASSEIVALVPTKFVLYDPETCKPTEIKTDDKSLKVPAHAAHANEVYKQGQSTTQHPQSYVFSVYDEDNLPTKIRIIDTPGMGDSRGVETDRLNMQNIIRCVTRVGKIHMLVIALPTNQSRLTVWFRFCIMELFKYLDRGTVENIAFLFTKARSTAFRVGDTIPNMRQLFDQIKSQSGVDIHLDDTNSFIIDNEAYRYLLAKDKVEFSEGEVLQFDDSWHRSSIACRKMVRVARGRSPKDFRVTAQLEALRTYIDREIQSLVASEGTEESLNKQIKEHEDGIRAVEHTISYLKRQNNGRLEMTAEFYPEGTLVCNHIDCTDFRVLPSGQYVIKPEAHPASPPASKTRTLNTKPTPCSHGKNFLEKKYIKWRTHVVEEDTLSENIQSAISVQQTFIDQHRSAIAALKTQIEQIRTHRSQSLQLLALSNQCLHQHSVVVRNETFLDVDDFQVIQQQAVENGVVNLAKQKKLESVRDAYKREQQYLSQSPEHQANPQTLDEVLGLLKASSGETELDLDKAVQDFQKEMAEFDWEAKPTPKSKPATAPVNESGDLHDDAINTLPHKIQPSEAGSKVDVFSKSTAAQTPQNIADDGIKVDDASKEALPVNTSDATQPGAAEDAGPTPDSQQETIACPAPDESTVSDSNPTDSNDFEPRVSKSDSNPEPQPITPAQGTKFVKVPTQSDSTASPTNHHQDEESDAISESHDPMQTADATNASQVQTPHDNDCSSKTAASQIAAPTTNPSSAETPTPPQVQVKDAAEQAKVTEDSAQQTGATYANNAPTHRDSIASEECHGAETHNAPQVNDDIASTIDQVASIPKLQEQVVYVSDSSISQTVPS